MSHKQDKGKERKMKVQLPDSAFSTREGNCEYYGPDFARAADIAKRTGGRVWERNNDRPWVMVFTEAQERAFFGITGPDPAKYSHY